MTSAEILKWHRDLEALRAVVPAEQAEASGHRREDEL